ncbi:MAG TPA: hypothetical protein PLH12_05810, partial [Pseudomonadales bacterium]|nr:hypothetical protein [Pseudomonadales bacterium]
MIEALWQAIRRAAEQEAAQEPVLASYLHNTVLRHHSLCSALGFLIAGKLDCQALPALTLMEVFAEAFCADTSITAVVAQDIEAI